MQEIRIDEIKDQEIQEIFNTPRLSDMFYKVKAYADFQLSMPDLNSYMIKKKFDFSILKSGRGEVSLYVKDVNGAKFIFKY